MEQDNVTVRFVADTKGMETAMKTLTDATEGFGKAFRTTIVDSVKMGRSFSDTIKDIGRRFADLALKKALQPLDGLLDNLIGSAVGGIAGGGAGGFAGFAKGAAFSGNGVTPFARGGIVANPTLFGFGRQLGVMGERGPEAVLPLSRGSDGRLGVAAPAGSNSGVSVIFNVQATDAASFRKSEGQISTMLARAVSRGQRGI